MQAVYRAKNGKPLSTEELASLLDVDRTTIDNLRKKGQLVPVGQFETGQGKPEFRFETSEIDRLLAECATGFAQPPTIAGIATGAVTLMDSGQAADILERSKSRVARYAQQKLLASLRFAEAHGSRYLICRASVEAFKTSDFAVRPYSTAEVLRVIGGGNLTTAKKLVAAGELVTVEVANAGNRLWYTRKSLNEVVAARLAPGSGISQDWIDDALSDPRPLMSTPQVGAALGLERRKVLEFADEGALRHIVRHRVRYFLPVAIDAYIESQEALRPVPIRIQELAAVFAVSSMTIKKWRAAGMLKCPLPHDCNGLYRSCAIALLGPCLYGSKMDVNEWYDYALSDTARILKLEAAAEYYECTTAELLAEIQSGQRTALRHPTKAEGRARWRIPAL